MSNFFIFNTRFANISFNIECISLDRKGTLFSEDRVRLVIRIPYSVLKHPSSNTQHPTSNTQHPTPNLNLFFEKRLIQKIEIQNNNNDRNEPNTNFQKWFVYKFSHFHFIIGKHHERNHCKAQLHR